MEFRYVSSVKGHLATRFGTGTPLGATIRNDKGEVSIDWNETEVVAIPLEEWNRSIKEYGRLLTAKAITERNAEDHKAWLALEKKASEADAERVKAEAAKVAADETNAAPDEKKSKGKKE